MTRRPQQYLVVAVLLAAVDVDAAESGTGSGAVANNASSVNDDWRGRAQDAGEQRESGSLVAPVRSGNYFQVGGAPILVGGGGIAVGAAAELSYVGDGPYRVGLQASPVVFAFKDGASQWAALVVAEPMLDTRLLGLGLSLGYSTGHDFSGPTIGGKIRLGATDGLHLALRISALREARTQVYRIGTIAPEPNHVLGFGEFDLHLAVPVAQRWAIVADASGLRAAFWRASLGVDARLTGTRGRGAMFLTINAGVALLEADFALKPGSDTMDFMGGPLLSLGYTVRL